jgi:hypothetical protein
MQVVSDLQLARADKRRVEWRCWFDVWRGNSMAKSEESLGSSTITTPLALVQ